MSRPISPSFYELIAALDDRVEWVETVRLDADGNYVRFHHSARRDAVRGLAMLAPAQSVDRVIPVVIELCGCIESVAGNDYLGDIETTYLRWVPQELVPFGEPLRLAVAAALTGEVAPEARPALEGALAMLSMPTA